MIPGTWKDYGTPLVNEASDEQFVSAPSSRKFTAGFTAGEASAQGIRSDEFLMQPGGTGTGVYQLDFWVYPVDRNKVRVNIDNAISQHVINVDGLTPNAWNRHTAHYALEDNVTTEVAFHSGAQETGTWYIDNAVLRKLLCPSSSSSCSSSSSAST